MAKVSTIIGIIILTCVWQTLTCFGCDVGFWGDFCDKQCPSDCATCTHDSVDSGRPCTSCVSGKYSGRAYDDSDEPYFDDCRHDCWYTCESCTSFDNCTECVDDRYGIECQYFCYSGCEGDVCDQIDGKCTCKTGFTSRFCKGQPSCTNNPCVCCKNNQCETNNDNYCTDGCIDSIWGKTCDKECPVNCETCTRDSRDSGRPCTSCVRGKYSGRFFDISSEPYYEDCREDCSDECLSCASYDNCTECVDGRYGPDCQYSCYSGCEGDVCDIDGKCTCKTGYTSRFYSCVSCASYDNCTECVDGRYGPECQYDCYSGCEGGVCDIDGKCTCKDGYTSRWCYSCIDGYWGKTCEKQCPVNCVSCSQNSEDRGLPCTSCVPGTYSGRENDISYWLYYDDCRYPCKRECVSCSSWLNCTKCGDGQYGSDCTLQCPTGCEGGKCNITDGSCPCVNGRYGTQCDNDCGNGCQGGTCDKTNGSCSCKSGFTGVNCDRCAPNTYGSYPNCTVCPDKCLTCSSSNSCDSCLDGYYNGYNTGTRATVSDCSNQCRINCKTCSKYNVCSACKNGFWGQLCANSCSNGCKEGTCNTNDGQCACKTWFKGDACNQCIAGRFGNDCSMICLSKNCKNNECDKLNGICLSCKVGYYGDLICDKTCSSRCSSLFCDFINGKCTNGCITGYSGDKCCIYNNNCEICSSSTQCLVCKSGYSGDICCLNNSNCQTCSSDTQCSVCIRGYSGDKCCVNNENCLTCVSPSECSKCKSGYDTNINCSECLQNKYGPNCGSDCNNNCLNNEKQSKCYGHNGTCVVGCQNGFYGDKCDLHCHQNCKQITCSRVNGICSHGCQEGFIISGSDCVPDFPVVTLGSTIDVSNDDGDFPVATLGVAIGGGVVVVFIIAGIVVFLIKQRNHRPQCCGATINDVTQGPEEIQLVAVNAGVNETTEVCIDGKISYFPGEVLGHGLHGVVYKGRYGRFERKTVAVKVITCSNDQDAKNTHTELQNIYKEIKAMEILAEDTHIIQLFDSYINTNSVYLVFSLAMGTMVDYVTNAPWQILMTSDDVVRGIVDGLNFTHTKNIVHRDLKPANIFIIEHEVSRLKVVIGDFGQAKATTGNMFTFTGNFGSNAYTAPEIWTAMSDTATTSVGTQFHKASDVFSLGLVAYYAISLGKHPFGNEMNAQVTISRGDLPTFTDIANLINSVAYEDMLKGMLKNNPNDRPSIQVVSEHPALYTSDKMIKYFGLKSDEFESKIRAGTKNTNLLEDPNLIPNGNWMNRLPVNLRTYLRSYKLPNRASPLYKGHEKEVRFLLRAVRNTAGHHQAYPKNTQAEMGIYPEGHVALWLTVCPGLLMHVYNKL